MKEGILGMMNPNMESICYSVASLDLVTKIDMWAKRCPKNIAIRFQEQSVTYAEFSSRRKALASSLIKQGLGPGSRVGICLPREPNLIIALTAVLSIGATFVPLPPDSPLERNKLISKLANLCVVLKSKSIELSQWPVNNFLNIEDVDWCIPRLFNEPVVDESFAAYILFTSGSTGLPKGVMVRRNNLAYFLSAINEVINFPEWMSLISTTTYGFDISILEFFLPLAHGGTLYLADEQQAREGQAIAKLLDQCERALLQATPATWRLLIDAGWPSQCKVGALCGGEILPVELGKQIFESATAAWNLYGPTETTIWSFYHKLQASDFTSAATSIPIGQPLPGTRFRLYSSDDASLSELVIEGPGVSAGYFEREDLTAEKFQFSEVKGDHFAAYLTGDHVQLQSDNSLVFIGRKDRQLKLNGYRIEPGEIESALYKSELVKQSVVSVNEYAQDDHRLVAYIVLNSNISGPKEDCAGVWLDVWEAAYMSAQNQEIPSAESGYTSSFSGEPIPDKDLREWVQATASRVLSFSHDSVLDVGCGIGMTGEELLNRGVRRYVGCDASMAAVDSAQMRLGVVCNNHATSSVLKMAAHELDALNEPPFDVVLLNSVIQYFPDVDYLIDVLRKASKLCSKGGVVVIGDVPHASLKPILSAAANRSREKMKRMFIEIGEGELWLDPAQIKQIAYEIDRVVNVETELRSGQGSDEMTRYRYDVIMRLDTDNRTALKPTKRYSYQDECLYERDLSQWLASAPPAFVLSGVPNSRISSDLQLSENAFPFIEGKAYDPEYIRRWASSHHRQVRIRWSDDFPVGAMDIFVGPPFSIDTTFEPQVVLSNQTVKQPIVRKAMDTALQQELIERLKEFLGTCVPPYMIPAHFVFLDRLPLTFNGKVDIAALKHVEPYSEPQLSQKNDQHLSVKQRVLHIWSNILMIPSVHPKRSFFAQGGSSLLIVKLTKALNNTFGLSLQVADLFAETNVELQTRLISKTLGLEDASSSLNVAKPSNVERRNSAIKRAARKRQKQL